LPKKIRINFLALTEDIQNCEVGYMSNVKMAKVSFGGLDLI
jgi:hypothetical protein